MNKWISFASIKRNEPYIEGLLKKLKIKEYNFCANGYGDYDLYVIIGLNVFKISINEIKQRLDVYKQKSYRKAQRQSKEYFTFISSEAGVDCWYKMLKYLVSSN